MFAFPIANVQYCPESDIDAPPQFADVEFDAGNVSGIVESVLIA